MKANHPERGKWETRDELDFLARLGRHTNGRFLGQRRPLLLGYRRGLGLRRVWIGLDRATILAAADEAVRTREGSGMSRVRLVGRNP